MRKAAWRYFDFPLLLVALLLVLLGGVMIYSSYEATLPPGERDLWDNRVFRQMILAVAGLLLCALAAALDYGVWISLHRWVYLLTIAILGFTLALGRTSLGAQRWLGFQAFEFQPSELCKILTILVLARHLGRDDEDLDSVGPFLVSALLLAPPVVLIYLQPDFGTALVLVLTWLGMAFLAGVRWRHMLLLASAGLILAPVAWFRLQGYMRDRIAMFLLPGYDPSGASYNVTQALISIGSGGWWGKGFLRGTQSQLHFLRVRHTDFVFSVLAEELGFIGASLSLVMFAFLILRLVRIATLARDAYGRLIVAGVATMLLSQTLINLGMNANLLPVTGLPLPLVSYGGSSLTTTLLALGLAQSVVMRHKEAEVRLL